MSTNSNALGQRSIRHALIDAATAAAQQFVCRSHGVTAIRCLSLADGRRVRIVIQEVPCNPAAADQVSAVEIDEMRDRAD